MRTLFLALVISLSSIAGAVDFYADAYRFADENHTGVFGLKGDHFGAEISAYDGKVSLINRQYIAFTNIEIGVLLELSNSHHQAAKDYRVIDIEGGLSLVTMPYFKVGSEWFAILKIDETNTPVVSVGFKLF
jgi:hypothetical protein